MPLQKLEFRPGVNRETTNYANEGGFFVSEKVRFRGGYAQKIGGWQNITASGGTFAGVCRYMWNYVNRLSQNLLAVATNQKLYVEFGGTYHDITPSQGTVTLGANPIATTSGSRLITITATAHGVTPGTYINISGATAVGGLTISGEYEIIGVATNDSYTIIAASAATSAHAASKRHQRRIDLVACDALRCLETRIAMRLSDWSLHTLLRVNRFEQEHSERKQQMQ